MQKVYLQNFYISDGFLLLFYSNGSSFFVSLNDFNCAFGAIIGLSMYDVIRDFVFPLSGDQLCNI